VGQVKLWAAGVRHVYIYLEVIKMQTAKLVRNGQSQAVRLPKEFRFDGDEVGIGRVGGLVFLYQSEKAWENFLHSNSMTDDFFEAMERRNDDDIQAEREQL
jgi:antitoxin VapB